MKSISVFCLIGIICCLLMIFRGCYNSDGNDEYTAKYTANVLFNDLILQNLANEAVDKGENCYQKSRYEIKNTPICIAINMRLKEIKQDFPLNPYLIVGIYKNCINQKNHTCSLKQNVENNNKIQLEANNILMNAKK